jgi:hypothetical protein
VLYVLADRLDDDPWLLLSWRGRARDQVLAHLRPAAETADQLAPWWPLIPGAPLPFDTGELGRLGDADASATLLRLGPLDVEVRGRPVVDALAAADDAVAEELSEK